MKKYFKIIISAMLLVSLVCTSAMAVTMYAPDGRTIDVPESDVELWQSVGWFTSPVVTIYAPDGREAKVLFADLEAYLSVGWYSVPVQYIYAPDGRCAVVEKNQVEAYVELGWYTEPVKIMYDLDGNTVLIFASDEEEYNKRGWYDAPVTYMCNDDGRAMLAYQSAIEAFEKEGWWELPALYKNKIRQYSRATFMELADFEAKYTDSSSVNKVMLTKMIKEGIKVSYTFYDVDRNGVHELVILADDKLIDIYTISGSSLIKIYENCNLGDTYRLHLLKDGYLFCEGTNGATTKSYKLHKLNGLGNALVKVKFEYCDTLGKQSYMTGFDYISGSDYNKKVKKYLAESVYGTFNINPAFN